MTARFPYWDYVLLIALLACLLVAMAGCKSATPTLPTNTHAQNNDSVRKEYIHDSIFIDRWHKEYTKGDTFYIHDSIDRWRDRYVYIHDSIDNSRTDTIYEQIQVVKPGNTFLQNSGIALWVIIALLLAGVIIGIILKFAK